VAGDKRQIGLHRPIALGSMQIGMADPAGFDLDQHGVGTGARHLDFLDRERLAEPVHHGRLHCPLHRRRLLWIGSNVASRRALALKALGLRAAHKNALSPAPPTRRSEAVSHRCDSAAPTEGNLAALSLRTKYARITP